MPDAHRRQRAVNFIIQSRADRKKFFPGKLFAEPAWDMLLTLYSAATERKATTISGLVQAAGVEESSVERWLMALEKEGLVTRGNKRGITLSERGWLAMDSYFENLSSGMI